MRNRLLPLALLALAAGLWFALRGEERQGSREPPSVSPDAIALPADKVEPSPLSEALAPPVANEPSVRTVATTAYEEELEDAVWVEGRIEFPPSTPSDEHVRVRGKGKEFKHGPLHTAEVSPDGAFRVAFAQGTKKADIELDARYLYLEDRVRVDPRKPAPILITPAVGGVIRGRVVPPPGAPEDANALIGCKVTLTSSRTVEIGDDLSFEFTGLAPDSKYGLICDPLIYETARVEDLFARSGGEITVDVYLLDGVNIAGRVIDEAGAPVAGALVIAEAGQWFETVMRTTRSEPGGEFQLRGVKSGSVRLSVQAEGYQKPDLDLGTLEHGARLAGTELRLLRGFEIAGRVLRPDGSPASGATVMAEPLDPIDAEASLGGSDTSNASGAFSIAGLKPGVYRVSADATRKETMLVPNHVAGKERSKRVSITLHAVAEQVKAGTTNLRLKLLEGLGVSGIVLDDQGSPLDRFTVRTMRTVDEDRQHVSFKKDAGGAFALFGLVPGTYTLTVEAKGFLTSNPVGFAVPLESPLAPIRLTRAPRLSGIVMTPGGLPAPKARIELMEQEGSSFGNSHYALACKSGNDGRFEVDDAGLGTFKVRAVQEGCVASDSIELTLYQGNQPADIILRLRPGATLTGMVVDADGVPCPDRRVELSGKGEGNERTDKQGAFVFTGLEPGEYWVEASPSTTYLKALGLSADARDALSGRNGITLDESGGHVVVQVPVACAVRVYGTLSVAGRATTGRLHFDHARGPVWADAQGAYEVLLPGPGEYDVEVEVSADLTVELEAVIRERSDQCFDLNILLGAIEGRVLGPQGPVADIDVDLHSAVADFTATTAEDGSYAVENVPAGSWTISAGGSRDEIYFEAIPSPYLRASLKGLEVVGGQRLRGVDLQLERAGIITGTVITPEGEPAKGMPAEDMSVIMSDASGDHEDVRFLMGNTFSVGGLEPGTYSFRVVSERRFAEGSAVAEAGKETKLELRLGPATLVRVPVHYSNSEDARILCRRSDGADFSNVQVVFGFDENARVFGPLPPGTYTLQVEGNGSPQAAKTLTLAGEPEVLVDLGL